MYSRNEIKNALNATEVLEDNHFKKFVRDIREINSHMIFSAEGRDRVKEILYGDSFDEIIGSLFRLCVELEECKKSQPAYGLFKDIYSSDLLDDIKHIGLPGHRDIKSHKDRSDRLYEVIALLNLYR